MGQLSAHELSANPDAKHAAAALCDGRQPSGLLSRQLKQKAVAAGFG
jgi:hypothetical protein